MEVVYNQEDLKNYFVDAVEASEDSPVLLDSFLNQAIELDVEAVSDGKKVIIGGQSFISDNLNICSNVVIAPGSVVLNDIKKPGIYNGNTLIKSF